MVKEHYCSSSEPGFSSQHLQGSSHKSITPVAGDLIPLLASIGTTCTQNTNIQDTTYTQNIEVNFKRIKLVYKL